MLDCSLKRYRYCRVFVGTVMLPTGMVLDAVRRSQAVRGQTDDSLAWMLGSKVLKYLARGVTWNTLRPGSEQYAGWEHWSTMTSDSAIDAGLAVVPNRPMMSEDRFRRRDNAWRKKDMDADDDILKEIPRWATRGVAAIYGRLIESKDGGSDIWPNRAAIKAVIERIEE